MNTGQVPIQVWRFSIKRRGCQNSIDLDYARIMPELYYNYARYARKVIMLELC